MMFADLKWTDEGDELEVVHFQSQHLRYADDNSPTVVLHKWGANEYSIIHHPWMGGVPKQPNEHHLDGADVLVRLLQLEEDHRPDNGWRDVFSY